MALDPDGGLMFRSRPEFVRLGRLVVACQTGSTLAPRQPGTISGPNALDRLSVGGLP